MTINEFLAARFAEEEAQVDAWASTHAASPAILDRVRSDLDVKRQVVATLVKHEQTARDGQANKVDRDESQEHVPGLQVACNVLAQPHSSHPNFDDAWLI